MELTPDLTLKNVPRSQALRERAPLIRKQQEEENCEGEDGNEEEFKTTRFAEGTKGDGPENKVKKAVLARDHSLGREYLTSDEAVSLEGFSWQDPFKTGGRSSSMSGRGQQVFAAAHGNLPGHIPAGRNSSSGSLGMAPPYRQTSGPPPPPPGFGFVLTIASCHFVLPPGVSFGRVDGRVT